MSRLHRSSAAPPPEHVPFQSDHTAAAAKTVSIRPREGGWQPVPMETSCRVSNNTLETRRNGLKGFWGQLGFRTFWGSCAKKFPSAFVDVLPTKLVVVGNQRLTYEWKEEVLLRGSCWDWNWLNFDQKPTSWKRFTRCALWNNAELETQRAEELKSWRVMLSCTGPLPVCLMYIWNLDSTDLWVKKKKF